MSPFDKLVPQGAPKKTGMNIAILSDFNIGGQPTYLMRALNKYTPHRARTIIWRHDYMDYDRDIVLGQELNPEACQEAAEIVKAADFFHFGRQPFNFPGIDFNKLINPRNCVVKYYGSELRNNGPALAKWHQDSGIQAITGTDWTMVSRLPGFYHLGSYFTAFGDMAPADIPKANHEAVIPIVHAGSGTTGIKRYDILEKCVMELQRESIPIALQKIEGKSNREALTHKAKCQMCFTSLHQGWGISGIEAMWMEIPVLAAIDPFILSLYPDQPAIPVDESNLKLRLKDLAEAPGMRWYVGAESRVFAEKHFKTKDIVTRYARLLELIARADEYGKGYMPAPEPWV